MAIVGLMPLEEYLKSIGLDYFHASQEIEKLTKVRVPPDLIRAAARSKQPQAMALPKAQALCEFLTEHMGRKITILDVKGLEVV